MQQQVPCYICSLPCKKDSIYLKTSNNYPGSTKTHLHSICPNCDMYYTKWLKNNLTPYQQGYCVHCMKPLAYTNNQHDDWDNTLLHEKCWLKLKQQDQEWLDDMKTQVDGMRQAFKTSQCYADLFEHSK